MRVVVAPDKFAGTLTAAEAASAIERGWRSERPQDEIDVVPMSDGGPGFVAVLDAVLTAETVAVATTGPHDGPVVASLLVARAGDGVTVYVEAAQVCGLAIAAQPSRPLEATTAGLPAVLRAALAIGAHRVVVGVGGTASTDGGRPVVEQLAGHWPSSVELVAAVDVDGPLLGPRGAARSFAAQKGATATEVGLLEARLAAWAAEAEVDPTVPGAGAGGGLGFGLSVLGARLESGASVVAAAVGLPNRVAAADLVITGEGRLDATSWSGKVVGWVAGAASTTGRPCLALVGESSVTVGQAAAHGVSSVWSVSDLVGPELARLEASTSLMLAAARAARE